MVSFIEIFYSQHGFCSHGLLQDDGGMVSQLFCISVFHTLKPTKQHRIAGEMNNHRTTLLEYFYFLIGK